MRVALPAWRMLQPRGGVGNTLCQLLRQYAVLAPEDEFVVYHDGPEADLPNTPNLVVRRLGATLGENSLTWNHWIFPRAVRRGAVDVVHNLNYILPRGLRLPSVVTIHDVSFERHPEWFPRRTGAFLRVGAQQAARRATAVVTDSQFSAAEIAALYELLLERIDVVPLAADERFRPTDPSPVRERYRLPERFVLYVGGIHERRRFGLLARACATVLGRVDAWLVVAGPVSSEQLAGTVSDPTRLRLLGYVPDEDLPGLYAAATCFAWPSVYEGFGLPALEALACGAPTVVSDASSLPEVVGDAALRVPPDNLEALADALNRLFEDATLRADLSRRGPAQAARFSWRATAEAMLAIYRRVVEAGT